MNYDDAFGCDIARQIGHAARLRKDKIVDDFCDRNGVSDELRAEFKKVNPIYINFQPNTNNPK